MQVCRLCMIWAIPGRYPKLSKGPHDTILKSLFPVPEKTAWFPVKPIWRLNMSSVSVFDHSINTERFGSSWQSGNARSPWAMPRVAAASLKFERIGSIEWPDKVTRTFTKRLKVEISIAIGLWSLSQIFKAENPEEHAGKSKIRLWFVSFLSTSRLKRGESSYNHSKTTSNPQR
jgi:hypothetical protein